MHLTDNRNAKPGDTWSIDSFEAQSRYVGVKNKRWYRLATRDTLEQARQVIAEHKKPNPTLDQMIGAPGKCEYRIVHRTGVCKMIE